ncbi:MAG: hypothetical protein RIE06_15500 [Roseibium album]|jgi:hypothetical protein|uniref:hypothetical protein n=1 Tax=Roseibium album TaxID=311410 RepID=UPI0032EDA1F1
MAEDVKNTGASVRARLLNISRDKDLLFELADIFGKLVSRDLGYCTPSCRWRCF